MMKYYTAGQRAEK